LASLLQQRRSLEVNQTLHDVWPSPALVHCIYIFRGSCPLTEFCQVQNSLFVQVLHSPILAALLHGTPAAGSAKLCGMVQGIEMQNFRRGRHLYSAGWPSRWASGYILVQVVLAANLLHFSADPPFKACFCQLMTVSNVSAAYKSILRMALFIFLLFRSRSRFPVNKVLLSMKAFFRIAVFSLYQFHNTHIQISS